ncbi:MAG TPA: tetratricopeptide repeat protein [Blastocatellia bacterium]
MNCGLLTTVTLIMSKLRLKFIWVTIIFGLASSGCGVLSSSSSTPASVPAPAALPSENEATEASIRFLEDRVRRDHDDFIAYNKLAGYYLQRQRETGSLSYLDLASRAARGSLAAMSAETNVGGLAALAQAEYGSHDFASARDHAIQLTQLDRAKSYPYQILGDALLELGDYDRATSAFVEMERLGTSAGSEARLARAAVLHGQTNEAARRLSMALSLALAQEPPSRETVAWIRWQLGEVAFSIGDYQKAQQHYRDALVTFPDYYRALAGLCRVLAAHGDMEGAIKNYQRAIQIIPDPLLISALGDLYKLSDREKEAAAQYALVEHIARLSEINGVIYNRQLSLFYADHDIKAGDAYKNAAKEYEVRRDIYGADAVAWTALKAGKLAEAQTAIEEALRLGARDARLLYHAGMIHRATGNNDLAREYLKRALTLNPQFDPLQAVNAKKALATVGE